MSIDGADHVRNLFWREEVDVELSAKFFLRFHESTNIVLAPKGVKRVIIVLSVSEKDGCSVMIALDIFSKIALHPFIIFKGVFSKKN